MTILAAAAILYVALMWTVTTISMIRRRDFPRNTAVAICVYLIGPIYIPVLFVRVAWRGVQRGLSCPKTIIDATPPHAVK